MADIIKAIVGVEVKGEAGLAKLSNSVGKTEAGLKKLVPVTNQANTAMVNFGRVVQDAPFGIIGIANNIDPLLQSFQSLKASTGSTGGALKALGASFLGPGGLALGVSAVTSALVLFGDKLFGSSKAASALAEENKKLSESIASELVQLTALVGIVQNTNSSRTDQTNALRAINEQYSKYLPNLGTEKITAKDLATAYDKITDSLLRQAVVKGLMKQIEIEVAKTAEKIFNIEQKRIQAQTENQKDVKTKYEQIGLEKKLGQAIDFKNKVVSDGYQSQVRSNQIAQKEIETTDVYGGVITKLKNDLKEALRPALSLISSFQDLGIELKDLKKEKVDPKKWMPYKMELKRPIQIEGRIFDFKNAQFGTDLLKAIQYKFSDRLKSMEKLVVSPKISLSPEYFLGQQAVDKLVKFTKSISDILDQGLRSAVNSSFELFGNAIGEALSGGNIANAFQAFAATIGSALQEMGKQIISVATAAIIAKKAISKLLTNPALALAAGVGLVAAGAAIKGAFSKNFGGFRAMGGPVTAGRSYVVGEKGPELFTPGVSGGITPNGRLGSMDGLFSGGGEYTFRLRGQDLVAAMVTTGRAQIRLV